MLRRLAVSGNREGKSRALPGARPPPEALSSREAAAHSKVSAAGELNRSNRANGDARAWVLVLRPGALLLVEAAVLAASRRPRAAAPHRAVPVERHPADLAAVMGAEQQAVALEAAVMEAEEAMEVVMADRSIIDKGNQMLPYIHRKGRIDAFLLAVLLALLLLLFGSGQSFAAKSSKQQTFASPADAVNSMVGAMKEGNTGKLVAIFGGSSRQLFSSGDEEADRQTREEFIKAYDEKNRLEAAGKDRMALHVGKEDWSWPIPIVKTGKRWRFDTKAGTQEILARRIGENELAVIQVCLAYVDAQREYAQDHRTGGIAEYAQKFISDQGKTNGLCWEEKETGKESPLGPLVGQACKAEYASLPKTALTQPYHGYYYKILKRQGLYAPGGPYEYVVDGKMIGGFALVAYPADYSVSGIMTFIVNQDGVVYEKDLGKYTGKAAESMTSFDPDQTWKKVQ